MGRKDLNNIKLSLEDCDVYSIQKIEEEGALSVGKMEAVMVFSFGQDEIKAGYVKNYNPEEKELLVERYLDGPLRGAMLDIYEVSVHEGNEQFYKFEKLSHEALLSKFYESGLEVSVKEA